MSKKFLLAGSYLLYEAEVKTEVDTGESRTVIRDECRTRAYCRKEKKEKKGRIPGKCSGISIQLESVPGFSQDSNVQFPLA